MLTADQSQMLSALGVPTGPGSSLPAGFGQTMPAAASWVDPQWPIVSQGPQWLNSFKVMSALAPMAPAPPDPQFGMGGI